MSIDSVFVHKMWNDHELSKMVAGGVPFSMLSDTGGKVGTIYGIMMIMLASKRGGDLSSILMV